MNALYFHKRIVLLLTIITICLLVLYPLFARIIYDAQLEPPDIYYMLPKSFWLYLTSIQLFLIFQQLFSRGKTENTLTRPFLIAVLPLLLYGALPLSQLPSIYTVNDATYHLANARKVIINGGVQTPAHGYLQYPGTSLLTAFLSNVTGITGGTPLLAFSIVLNTMFVLLIAFVLFRIGKRIIGPKTGFLLPIIYFIGNTTFFTQFCPQNFALTLYFLSILILIYPGKRTSSSKPIVFILMLISSALVVIHPITNLFHISTLFGLYIVQKISKKPIGLKLSLPFFLFGTAITFLWWVFFANENFSVALNSLSAFLTKGAQLAPEQLSILQYPSFLSQILLIFSRSLYTFAGIAAVCGIAFALFRRQRRIKVFIGIFLGILSIGIFPFLLFAGEWADRTLLFAYFPMSALAIYGLNSLFGSLDSKRRFAFYHRKILVCILIALIPLAFMGHHQYDSIQNVNTWDFSITKFLVEFSPSRSIALPWNPGMRDPYYYINPNISDYGIFIEWLSNPEIMVFSVKTARLYEYTQGNSTAYTNEMLSYANITYFNRFYDNGFTMAYALTNLTKTQ